VRARNPLLHLPVVLLFLFSSGCTYVHSVFRSDQQRTYRYAPPFDVASDEFRRSAASLGNALVEGNRVQLLNNGDAIFASLIKDIDEAKKSINFEIFIFKSDEAGKMVAKALIGAAQRGVQVRLLIDTIGSKLKRGLKEDMKKAGVKVQKYRPLRLFTIYKIAQRTHRRVIVIDGRTAYTGGIGIAKDWMGDARNTKEWRDSMVRVEGPVVSQMQSVFSEGWTYTTGEILTGNDFYPQLRAEGDVAAQAIKASKGDQSSQAKLLYYMAIRSARKTIRIVNPYFLPDSQVRRELMAAAKRGVDIQVMVPGRHVDQPMVRNASWFHYGRLLKAGVKIFEYEPTMIHQKTVSIDGIYATIGTINFDAISMNRNAEVSLSFHDRAFVHKLDDTFEEDKKRCKEITYAKWKDRGPGKRLAEMVFWIWEPYY
jgi:cardiolipin synthase A/B